MKLKELCKSIENEGFKTGYDIETDNLIIMSQGYQKLGEIDYQKQFDVHFNKHFNRQTDRKTQINVFKAIWAFVETDLYERDC